MKSNLLKFNILPPPLAFFTRRSLSQFNKGSLCLMVLILLFGQLGWAKDVIFQRMSPPPSSLPIPEKIKNQTLILANDDNLIMCLDVYDGTTSFTRVMKTDLNGGLIWSYDYGMTFTAQAPVLHPFSITRDVNGSGYVICGARDNVNHDTLSNDLTPFTLAIDENGSYVTSRTYFHSVTPADLSAVALKIVATPQGNYAMTGFQGYEFNYLTTNQGRRGFLHILDGNLNTTNYVAFHGYYSGYLWSNCKWDLFGEVISFIPSGAQDEVYFVAGAVTDSVGWVSCGDNYWGIGLLFDNGLNLIWQTAGIRSSTFISADYDSETDQIYAAASAGTSALHSSLFSIDASTGTYNQWTDFSAGGVTQPDEYTANDYPFSTIKVKGDTLLLFGYSTTYNTKVGNLPPYTSYNRDTVYMPVFFKVEKSNFQNVYESHFYYDFNNPILLLSCDYSKLLGMSYKRYSNTIDEKSSICGIQNSFSNVGTPICYTPKSFIDFDGSVYFLSFEGASSSYAVKLKTSYPSEVCSKKVFYSSFEGPDTNYINEITILPDYWDELTPEPDTRTPIINSSDCNPPGPSPFYESRFDKLDKMEDLFSIESKNDYLLINIDPIKFESYSCVISNLIGQKLFETKISPNTEIKIPTELKNSVLIITIYSIESKVKYQSFKLLTY
jgi:hypothetical protein